MRAKPSTPVYRPRWVLRLPRLDRSLRGLFSQRVVPLDTIMAKAIERLYGLQIQHATGTYKGAGRGDHLVLHTTQGKILLKRYKASLELPAVIHEHSILRHLESVDFPAPRLLQQQNQRTFFQKNGRIYALFVFMDGYFQGHNYFFGPGHSGQMLSYAGQTLAQLHLALKDFHPEGLHPNGFRSRQASRWRDMDWYRDLLRRTQLKASQLDSEVGTQLTLELETHANSILEQLDQLQRVLNSIKLPRLIIHGDFGPYNLFYKAGHPLVVLDFELARLDWRLTDLASALNFFARTRFGFRMGRMENFLRGYFSSAEIDETELAYLPAVWLFLTLRRVLVCWNRFGEDGNPKWLGEARAKLAQANWIRAQGYQLADSMEKVYRSVKGKTA